METTFVLFGYGDVGKNKFTPALMHYLQLIKRKEKMFPLLANIDILNYLIVDVDESKRKEITYLQEKARREEIPIEVKFFNFNSPKDREEFSSLLAEHRVSLAYIASPNKTHAKYIDLLVDKSELILVEKPLVDHKHEIESIIRKHGTKKLAKVRLIDHYLFKDVTMVYLRELGTFLGRIGGIEEVEFFLLEPNPIRESRKWLYGSGMIRDLGSHFFSIVLKHYELGVNEFDPNKFKITDVKKAVYDRSYIPEDIKNPKETFAIIELEIDGIKGKVSVGKGLDITRKQFILRGSGASLIIDFARNEITLRISNRIEKVYQKDVFRYHEYHNILYGILNLDNKIGLSFDMAVKEVELFEETDKFAISKTYRIGEIPFNA